MPTHYVATIAVSWTVFVIALAVTLGSRAVYHSSGNIKAEAIWIHSRKGLTVATFVASAATAMIALHKPLPISSPLLAIITTISLTLGLFFTHLARKLFNSYSPWENFFGGAAAICICVFLNTGALIWWWPW